MIHFINYYFYHTFDYSRNIICIGNAAGFVYSHFRKSVRLQNRDMMLCKVGINGKEKH